MKKLVRAAAILALVLSCESGLTAQPTRAQTPTRFDSIPKFMESVLPPEAKGRVVVFERYVETHFVLPDTPGAGEQARQSARDFVAAAYEIQLPIRGVKIEIGRADKTTGLLLVLGADVAAKYRDEIRRAAKLAPAHFTRLMTKVSAEHSNGLGANRGYIGGAWAEAPMPAPGAVEIEPADDSSSVNGALESLRKVSDALDAGVSYLDYRPLVAAAQARVAEASRKIVTPRLKTELQNAVADYEFAGRVWMATSGRHINASSEVGEILKQKYALVPAQGRADEIIDRAAAFNAVVKSARRHADAAASLVK